MEYYDGSRILVGHVCKIPVCTKYPWITLTNLFLHQFSFLLFNFIMVNFSASERSETPVLVNLRTLPRQQSIVEQSDYASFQLDALTQFLIPPGFYDQQEAAAARDEYKKYCKTPPL